MKILQLVPNLAYGGAARQVCQLARGLPPRLRLTVAVLGRETPLTASLRQAGVTVVTLGHVRCFDPGALWRLRTLVRDLTPDVIHAWRPAALRALALAVGRPKCPLIVSDPLRPGARRLGWLDRWLLGCARRILVGSAAEAERCRRFGLPAATLELVRPAVEAVALPAVATSSGAPRLVCAGRMERHKGFREAVWAFDILHFVAPDLRLHLIGDGPERSTLERFAEQIQVREAVDFAGVVSDLTGPLAAAQIVWVPSLAPTGMHVALEALALGRPVVASRLPELVEIITDGTTGCLADPGDKVGLARQTQRLLHDADRRRQFGEAGRLRVLRDFSTTELFRHVTEVYEKTAA